MSSWVKGLLMVKTKGLSPTACLTDTVTSAHCVISACLDSFICKVGRYD